MEVTVPVGSEAAVYLPIRKGQLISENGHAITGSDAVQFVSDEAGYRVFAVKSGKYQFSSK